MDESDGLENRYGGNLIVGSNPTPSATFRHEEGSQISVYEPSSLGCSVKHRPIHLIIESRYASNDRPKFQAKFHGR